MQIPFMEVFRDKSKINLLPDRNTVSHFQYTSSNIKEVKSHRNENDRMKASDFETTTEIIAKRIVEKQLELGKVREGKRKSVNFSDKPQIAVRMNNVVVQRILRIQMKEAEQGKTLDMLHYRPEATYTQSSSPTRTSSYQSLSTCRSEIPNTSSLPSRQNFVTPKSISRSSLSSIRSSKFVNSQSKKSIGLPRFQLSTNTGTRTKVGNKIIQNNIGRDFAKSFGNQTDFEEFQKASYVQVTSQSCLVGKKLQTRLYKTNDVETDPITFYMPSKSTNTNVCYSGSYMDHHTQFFEFMSDGDLFCLDWINKYLFPINLNPFSVIVDKKLREASELGTKSTFFSESKTLRNFRKVIEKPCCKL